MIFMFKKNYITFKSKTWKMLDSQIKDYLIPFNYFILFFMDSLLLRVEIGSKKYLYVYYYISLYIFSFLYHVSAFQYK